MSEWNGNGLADGTTITSGNINTAGNGTYSDTVSLGTSGATGTIVTAGDGVDVTGPASSDIRRIDITGLATRTAVVHYKHTHNANSTSGSRNAHQIRNATGKVGELTFSTSGLTQVIPATGTVRTGPTMTLGHQYEIWQWVLVHPTAPTTSNGRIITIIKNLTNSAWNTTGYWFDDTGYTVDCGTADISIIRFAKIDSGVYSTANRWERMQWFTSTTVGAADDTYAEVMAKAPIYTATPIQNINAARLSNTSARISWTHPGDAPNGVSIARWPGSVTTDGNGADPGEAGYDPLTISGATLIANGLTSSPYDDTGLTPGVYSYDVARTA